MHYGAGNHYQKVTVVNTDKSTFYKFPSCYNNMSFTDYNI